MSGIDFEHIQKVLSDGKDRQENIQRLLSIVIQFSTEESLKEVIRNLSGKYFTPLKNAVLKAEPLQNGGKSKKRRQTKRRRPTKRRAGKLSRTR